jgi:hypothetical protein
MLTDKIQKISAQIGMTLMTLAAVTGMLELPSHTDTRVVLPGQPSFALSNDYNQLNDPIRREREDPAPHYASYSIIQRTHSRAASK